MALIKNTKFLKTLYLSGSLSKSGPLDFGTKNNFPSFLLMDDVTSISLEGSRMAINHSLTYPLTHSLTLNALSNPNVQRLFDSFNTENHESIDDEISQFNQVSNSVANHV